MAQSLEKAADVHVHLVRGSILMYCHSVNTTILSAWRKVDERVLWQHIVDTAALHVGTCY